MINEHIQAKAYMQRTVWLRPYLPFHFIEDRRSKKNDIRNATEFYSDIRQARLCLSSLFFKAFQKKDRSYSFRVRKIIAKQKVISECREFILAQLCIYAIKSPN